MNCELRSKADFPSLCQFGNELRPNDWEQLLLHKKNAAHQFRYVRGRRIGDLPEKQKKPV
ncbi:MAG TPA: hypothetical protein P5114_04740 [Hyphomicrobiaceae bacterium]|nr:hypothetical protein [Hyphomicrobiaceae bacterium]